MASITTLASVDEQYFREIQNADWKKQYLDSHGNVQRRTLLTKIFSVCKRFLPSCFTRHFVVNITTARACLAVRMSDYSPKSSELLRGQREDLLKDVATKFNEILLKIDKTSTLLIDSRFLMGLSLFQSSGTPGGPPPSLFSSQVASAIGVSQVP